MRVQLTCQAAFTPADIHLSRRQAENQLPVPAAPVQAQQVQFPVLRSRSRLCKHPGNSIK